MFQVSPARIVFVIIGLFISSFGGGPNPIATDRLETAVDARAVDTVSKTDWSGIRAAYEASRRSVYTVDSGCQFRNPEQQWSTQFDGRGFLVKPDDGTWTWGLDLQSYGWGNAMRTVSIASSMNPSRSIVDYRWDSQLSEWYKNDSRGLEHGYTIHSRPSKASGILTFNLLVRGGLSLKLQNNGRDVHFVDSADSMVLSYSGLAVVDVDGKSLSARFEATKNTLQLSIDDLGAHYPITVDPIVQPAYLKASNTEPFDGFGASVAAFGDTVAVGAVGEASNATGIDGNQSDNSKASAGAVYVFVRTGTTWSQQAYLKASNTDAGDEFGFSVSLSGNTLVVGSGGDDSNATGVNGDQTNNTVFDSGAVFVFVRDGTTWSQQGYLKASNTEAGDVFGRSVSISGDTIVVGAPYESSDATGVNGNQNNNNATNAGAAYVFVRNGTTWSQQAYLKASNTGVNDTFGDPVSVSGNTIVAGAMLEDSNATGVNGNQSNNSATQSGAAYVFVRDGTTWSQQAYLKASNTGANDQFGNSVSISGNTAVVGAWQEGSNATGINGNQSNNTAGFAGAAYTFVRSGSTWTQQGYLKASNTGASDQFGYSVSLSGDLLIVGARYEGSIATGVNGDQSDNSASASGAAYVFNLDNNPGIAVFGTGTPGCTGTETLSVTHAPMINSPHFTLICSNAPPLSLGLGLITDSQDLAGSDPFALGVLLHTDFALATEVIAVDFYSDATGYSETVGLAIPNNPLVIGATYYACALWAWPISTCVLPGFNPYNLSTSRGIAMTILVP